MINNVIIKEALMMMLVRRGWFRGRERERREFKIREAKIREAKKEI